MAQNDLMANDIQYEVHERMKKHSSFEKPSDGEMFLVSRMAVGGRELYSSHETVAVPDAWETIKILIKKLRARHPDRMDEAHITVMCHLCGSQRNECWFLYEWAPLHSRKVNRATKMFREMVKV